MTSPGSTPTPDVDPALTAADRAVLANPLALSELRAARAGEDLVPAAPGADAPTLTRAERALLDDPFVIGELRASLRGEGMIPARRTTPAAVPTPEEP